MILHWYFARKFFWTFTAITMIFVIILALVDIADEVQDFPDLPFTAVLEIVLLNAPSANYEILPLVMILATVALFLRLARSSELVVVRSAGRSAMAGLIAPVMVAGLIGVLTITMLNPIVAASSKRYNDLISGYRGGGANILAIASEGLWLRQGSADGQSVIHARGTTNADALELTGVTIVTFSPDGKPTQQINANRAQLSNGSWILHNAKIWSLADDMNPEATAQTHQRIEIPTTLTRQRILDTLGQQDSVSVYDLPQLIRDLREAGFSTKQYEVWLQVQLARPLFLVAMVMIGAAFTMRHVRFGGTGIAVLSAVLLGFSIYFVRNFAQILGENGQLPIFVAAWAPPFAAILLSLGLLLHAEDG